MIGAIEAIARHAARRSTRSTSKMLGDVDEFIASNELLDPESARGNVRAARQARAGAKLGARPGDGRGAVRAARRPREALGLDLQFPGCEHSTCSAGFVGTANFAFAKLFFGAHAVGLQRARGKRVPRGGGAQVAVTDIVEVRTDRLVALFGGAGLVEMWTGSTWSLLSA